MSKAIEINNSDLIHKQTDLGTLVVPFDQTFHQLHVFIYLRALKQKHFYSLTNKKISIMVKLKAMNENNNE